MLDKLFDHAQIEPRIVEKSKSPVAQTVKSNVKSDTFTITLPPPNITGSLHLGHAFTSVIQDILLRFKRQHGYATLGQPGIDHAGIATQIIVANQLRDRGINWQRIGRSNFIEQVWAWKEQSGGTILYQLVRLGMSIDLDRVRFTMDDEASDAVLYAFTQLYKDGLIYRAKRIVNWDPILKTAVSDLEVSNKTENGKMWYIRYPMGQNDFITIATTRPETLFGDQALAVHPDDERYKHLIGTNVRIPLTDRVIPIIADECSDPQKGSGIFKVTPAHDFTDFDVGTRHNLPLMVIMDECGCLNDEVPAEFRHLPVSVARDRVVNALNEKGLLEKTEDIVHSVPHNDRSGAVIEPMVTNQWFLETKKLADMAIKAVEDGHIKFVPEHWMNTYFEWLRNIQPWCLSRQIWWGHQIPVWYADNGKMFCARTEEEAIRQAAKYFDVDVTQVPKLTRDPDVLDTWFSSALWPFVTLGWPNSTDELNKYYPTDVLVTGFDIIFFWVSRMIMFGLYFTKKVPFKVVYINPLVRDEKGQKMSKSKGNVIDPLHLMNKYGTDALRFTLATLAIPGRDIRLGESLVESGRNFITKVWNAAKFLELKGGTFGECIDISASSALGASNEQGGKVSDIVTLPLNQWIIQKLFDFKKQSKSYLDEYRIDLFAQSIYKFLKDTFCDVYIESVKTCDDEESKKTMAAVFAEFLKVAHPIMPFITEFLWNELGGGASSSMLLLQSWADVPDVEATQESTLVEYYVSVAEEIRSIRGIIGVKDKLALFAKSNANDEFLLNNAHWLKVLARLSSVEIMHNLPAEGIRFVVQGQEFCLKYGDTISAEVFEKKVQALQGDIQRLTLKIGNEQYKQAKPENWDADVELKKQKEWELAKLQAYTCP
ncbi:MAG: valine--tRNA ligase [Holosporales bacterium]|jgi:valyl-tRNA synthetase|nr:valine--tRNA ligase [Holosporales bacterium]